MLRSSWRGACADHHVEFGAVAAVGLVAAPGADHAVAMREPGFAPRRVPAGGQSLAESRLGRVAVAIRQRRERQPRARFHRELGRQRLPGAAQAALALRVAPLHDEVVLRPDHGQPVEVLFAHEGADVGDVLRRECRRQLDHDAARRELQVERRLRVERTPVRGRGGCQHVAHRPGGDRGRVRRCRHPGPARGRPGRRHVPPWRQRAARRRRRSRVATTRLMSAAARG